MNASFDVDELIEAVYFLIDNPYIAFKYSIYRQKIGIPMGANCVQFLANIYLHVYEYKFLQTSIYTCMDTSFCKHLFTCMNTRFCKHLFTCVWIQVFAKIN